MKNIAVYNFFQESAETINEFLDIIDSSVFFAISLQDLYRICSEHQIDLVIIKLYETEIKYLLEMMLHFQRIKFIIPMSLKTSIPYQNVLYFADDSVLSAIGKQIIKKWR